MVKPMIQLAEDEIVQERTERKLEMLKSEIKTLQRLERKIKDQKKRIKQINALHLSEIKLEEFKPITNKLHDFSIVDGYYYSLKLQ